MVIGVYVPENVREISETIDINCYIERSETLQREQIDLQTPPISVTVPKILWELIIPSEKDRLSKFFGE